MLCKQFEFYMCYHAMLVLRWPGQLSTGQLSSAQLLLLQGLLRSILGSYYTRKKACYHNIAFQSFLTR